MKKAILLTSLVFLIGGLFVVRAQYTGNSYEVTDDDLAKAGMENILAVASEKKRFTEPVLYFRVKPPEEPLSGKDCGDCGDLVAVYAGKTDTVPSWITSNANPVRKIGKRIQIRKYSASKKLVIIVTGPDGEKTAVLSKYLASKF